MEKPVSTQLHCPNELDRLQGYTVRVMPDQKYTAQLGQQINQIILNSSDSETMLRQTAQAVGEAFRVDCCLITVTAEDQITDQIGYWHIDKNLSTLPQQQILTLEQLAALIKGTELLAINDVQTIETRLLAAPDLPIAAEAILAIPTWFQGRINGMIFLFYSQPHDWSESERAGASAIASSVAIALSQVSQTKLLASLQQQVQISTQYKTVINQLTTASRSSLDLEQILQLALSSAASALQVDRGLILTLKYVDPLFKTREWRGKIPKARVNVVCEWLSNSEADTSGSLNQINSLLNQSFWISECLLCQQAFINSPNPIVVSNKNALAAIAPETDIAPIFLLSTMPSLLMFPLEHQGTVLGFLVLQHQRDRLWHAEELALVEIVSALASTAIIQSQTLRQVQSLVDERTAQLQRSLEVQGKLYEKTRQQLDQLRHLNQLKDEFVSTMNHELRTPLTSMSLAIRMLRQPEITTERQTKYLDILEQQCNQEIQLIYDLLKLQELESNKNQLKLETIDLKPKIQELAQSFTEKWADKGLTITLDLPQASLLVQTDSESIERILKELLTNAGKYSDPDTNVALKATYQINQFVLNLTNIGPGISPEDVTHIFDKFRRGQGVTKKAIQGTGLGLALVKCLVQNLNGIIDVSSIATEDSSHETCFTLTLPQSFAPRSTPV